MSRIHCSVQATIPRLHLFQHRELAPLLWAFAWSRHNAVELMEAATPQLLLRLPSFGVLELSNLLWAINSNEFYNSDLMGCVPDSQGHVVYVC